MGSNITDFFKGAATHWQGYIAALTVIGGVAMALLQTAKDLLPLRQWFQAWYLRNWFKRSGASAAVTAAAEQELLVLAVNGDQAALYDLQIEQVCGQYTAAIQVVLEFPARYPNLLQVTAHRADPADVAIVLAPCAPPTQAYIDAKNRVTHQCQRAIDSLQITAGFRWKWCLQLAAFAVSTGLAWIALHYGQKTMQVDSISVGATALLAGFLAPVGKDLMAVLDKARGQ